MGFSRVRDNPPRLRYVSTYFVSGNWDLIWVSISLRVCLVVMLSTWYVSGWQCGVGCVCICAGGVGGCAVVCAAAACVCIAAAAVVWFAEASAACGAGCAPEISDFDFVDDDDVLEEFSCIQLPTST